MFLRIALGHHVVIVNVGHGEKSVPVRFPERSREDLYGFWVVNTNFVVADAYEGPLVASAAGRWNLGVSCHVLYGAVPISG